MFDQQTKSFWSHLLGEAIDGELKGTKLTQYPSVMTDWKTWRKLHPQGSVVLLQRTANEYRRNFYQQPEFFVLGIYGNSTARFWPFSQLQKNLAINETWDDIPVVITFDRPSFTARMFRRTVKDKTLTFEFKQGKLRDQETGSIWHPVSGQATAGSLKGEFLSPMPAFISYREAWEKFHPTKGGSSSDLRRPKIPPLSLDM